MSKDWRVVIDDTGGPDTGWPSVWSDSEDRSVIHVSGFHQEYWEGPTKREAVAIAQVVAAFMNGEISTPSWCLKRDDRIKYITKTGATRFGTVCSNDVEKRELRVWPDSWTITPEPNPETIGYALVIRVL